MNRPPLWINTVEIPVGDLTRAVEWYKTALGFLCQWSDERHALLSHAEVSENGGSYARILLVETDDTRRLGFTNSSNGLHHSVIDFQTPELDELHGFLRRQGTSVDDLQPPLNAWAPRGFGFFDSEGNRLAAFTYAASAGRVKEPAASGR
jgi:catechol 2,3-dioxygenase-like lactoylglutathione lyase family enzyme